MPRRNNTRAGNGTGTIRKKTVTKNGQKYTYWEARVTIGQDTGTGKQIQKSFTGQTQKEVREKMQAVAVQVNEGTYQEPTKLTLGEWLDIWVADYLHDVKPRTIDSYTTTINTHIKPALGAAKLAVLTSPEIQKFYNQLHTRGRKVPKHDELGNIVKKNGKTVYELLPMSAKSIKNIHGVLHSALEQAVEIGYIRANPSSPCKLPRIEKHEIKPLDNDTIAHFMLAIRGHKYENVYITTLFTGMREGEVLGLTWDCIDFNAGTITIKQQLQKERAGTGKYHLVSTKNGKSRRITPASSVMDLLRQQRQLQTKLKKAAYELWDNPMNLVFTNEVGHNLSAQTVYLHFKNIMSELGFPNTRFHDLRHSYAVVALQSGDDVKTVQENLGHFSAAFTLDVYGHVTEKMKLESANRMEQFIKSISPN